MNNTVGLHMASLHAVKLGSLEWSLKEATSTRAISESGDLHEISHLGLVGVLAAEDLIEGDACRRQSVSATRALCVIEGDASRQCRRER